MIKTVIRNILSNAIKFSFLDSVIDISSSITLDNVQIAISDKGVGLTNDQINQLFYQYGKTTSRTKNERGTGLGLYICKKLIEKNNGKILVESKVGNGTKFIVEIPIPITK
jgi:signal transduction histidine kinase